MTHNIRSMLRILSRRNRQPTHLVYRKRMGACIVDREAFAKAWDNAMPVDTFTTTHKEA